MAFNVVDKQGRHRGIILGKNNVAKKIIKTPNKVTWLCGLTDFTATDAEWDLERIKEVWGVRWKYKTRSGGYDESKFNNRLDVLLGVHKINHLNFEEKLRFIHAMKLGDQKEFAGKNIGLRGYILIDPLTANYRDNRIIVDLPDQYPDSVCPDCGQPIYAVIAGRQKLRFELGDIYRTVVPSYSTIFNAKSGNLEFQFSMPFLIKDLPTEKNVQIFYEKEGVHWIHVDGFMYEVARKEWSIQDLFR